VRGLAAVILGIGISGPMLVAALMYRRLRARSFTEQTTLQQQLMVLGMAAVLTTLCVWVANSMWPLLGDAPALWACAAGVVSGIATRHFYMTVAITEEVGRRLKALSEGLFNAWRVWVQWYAGRLPTVLAFLVLAFAGVLAYGGYDLGSTNGTLSAVAWVAAVAFAVAGIGQWVLRTRRSEYWLWRDCNRASWILAPKALGDRVSSYCDSVASRLSA